MGSAQSEAVTVTSVPSRLRVLAVGPVLVELEYLCPLRNEYSSLLRPEPSFLFLLLKTSFFFFFNLAPLI